MMRTVRSIAACATFAFALGGCSDRDTPFDTELSVEVGQEVQRGDGAAVFKTRGNASEPPPNRLRIEGGTEDWSVQLDFHAADETPHSPFYPSGFSGSYEMGSHAYEPDARHYGFWFREDRDQWATLTGRIELTVDAQRVRGSGLLEFAPYDLSVRPDSGVEMAVEFDLPLGTECWRGTSGSSATLDVELESEHCQKQAAYYED